MARPKSTEPKQHNIRIRFNDRDLQKLDYCAEKTGMNRSEVVRYGIDKLYREIQEQK